MTETVEKLSGEHEANEESKMKIIFDIFLTFFGTNELKIFSKNHLRTTKYALKMKLD